MSRDTPSRTQLLEQLTAEVRANQRATDIVDDLVCELLDINRTDARCLDILEQHGKMSAGELARHSSLTTGAITAVVDRLERRGFAHRVADPADRRRVLIEPTPLAYQTAAELMEPLGVIGAELAGRYSDEQLALMVEFTRGGREMQERHAEWLRERLRDRAGSR